MINASKMATIQNFNVKSDNFLECMLAEGRAIAQAVSRRFLTATARVRAQGSLYDRILVVE
jgi:hypothetical protein